MSRAFASIRSISPADPDTWQDRLFLTVDMDWACDEVLADTADLLGQAGATATWFVTHDTPLLARLRREGFELGIHPNISQLGGAAQGDVEVLDQLLAIVPDARSVRSHYLTQNSYLQHRFADNGLTHDCNHFIPEQAGMCLKPWILWNGLIKVPHFWEDDLACMYPAGSTPSSLVNRAGLKVFAFHPIHVFLNTEHLGRYERTRDIHKVPGELLRHRYEGAGTRNALMALLEQ